MNPDTTLIGIALAMLFIEILLSVGLGFYITKMLSKIDADDAAILLRVNAVAKEMRESLLTAERK